MVTVRHTLIVECDSDAEYLWANGQLEASQANDLGKPMTSLIGDAPAKRIEVVFDPQVVG